MEPDRPHRDRILCEWFRAIGAREQHRHIVAADEIRFRQRDRAIAGINRIGYRTALFGLIRRWNGTPLIDLRDVVDTREVPHATWCVADHVETTELRTGRCTRL